MSDLKVGEVVDVIDGPVQGRGTIVVKGLNVLSIRFIHGPLVLVESQWVRRAVIK